MVNFAPESPFDIPEMPVPDFSRGETAQKTAEYFRFIGQPEKAEAAIRGAAGTPDKVFYILTQPGIGGFKEVGKTGVQYVNLDVLDTDFQQEVHAHERVHNAHEGRWGKINMPGYEFMTPSRRAVIFEQLGGDAGLDETGFVEWLTQYTTQQKLGWDTQSSYDGLEVPESQRLFRTLEEKSGRKIVGSFLQMALEGATDGQQEFADGVRIGGNIILLEKALWDAWLSTDDAQKMSEIIEEQKKDFVVRDRDHANRLVDSYARSWEPQVSLQNNEKYGL